MTAVGTHQHLDIVHRLLGKETDREKDEKGCKRERASNHLDSKLSTSPTRS